MKVKKGVVLFGLQIEMQPVLISADEIWKENNQVLVVTETVGGIHSPPSLHPYGYAVDLRSRYFRKKKLPAIAAKLRKALGPDYDVIVHRTHIHVEYDKAKYFIGLKWKTYISNLPSNNGHG